MPVIDPNFPLQIKGLKEIEKALFSYSEKLGKKVTLDALKEGAKLTIKVIRATAPVYKGPPKKNVHPGTLKKGFSLKNSKIHNGRRGPTIGVFISLKKVKGGGRDNPKDPFYGKFIIKGWRAGKNRRLVKPNNFFDRAFSNTRIRATRQIEAALKNGAAVVAKNTRGLT